MTRGIPDPVRVDTSCLPGHRHDGVPVDCLDETIDAGHLCRHCLKEVRLNDRGHWYVRTPPTYVYM